MDERKTLALQAVHELLDPDRGEWDELVVANRALVKAIATGRPMTRRNARLVAVFATPDGVKARLMRPRRKQMHTRALVIRAVGEAIPPTASKARSRRLSLNADGRL
jgi:hypothetical protein